MVSKSGLGPGSSTFGFLKPVKEVPCKRHTRIWSSLWVKRGLGVFSNVLFLKWAGMLRGSQIDFGGSRVREIEGNVEDVTFMSEGLSISLPNRQPDGSDSRGLSFQKLMSGIPKKIYTPEIYTKKIYPQENV